MKKRNIFFGLLLIVLITLSVLLTVSYFKSREIIKNREKMVELMGTMDKCIENLIDLASSAGKQDLNAFKVLNLKYCSCLRSVNMKVALYFPKDYDRMKVSSVFCS